jgi:hypothetical protein
MICEDIILIPSKAQIGQRPVKVTRMYKENSQNSAKEKKSYLHTFNDFFVCRLPG